VVVVGRRRDAAASSAASRRLSRRGCAPPPAQSRCGSRMRRPGHIAAVTADIAAAVATADAFVVLDGGRGRHVDVGSHTCSFQPSELAGRRREQSRVQESAFTYA